ncbi:MAG: 30S ribosomal protein S20 [Dehalococcoidia bacterium]|nr:30S ribosomal protein S20 [Dehalococcoidia bacterium]MDD5493673.1 30S ribosomal protein S20 [Dehalococcoidia bacterium]
MPKTRTAEKSARSAARKAVRNKSIRTGTKSSVARAEKLIVAKKTKEAKPAVIEAISTLDRAAKKKVIHPNTAARKKSRLMKKLNKASKKA